MKWESNLEITSGKAFAAFEEAVKLTRLRGLAAAAAAVLGTGFMCLADTTYPLIAFPISLSLYKEVTETE